ncbi:hypothetical protein JHK87_039309 [Glycine soja]|nr:hypothetical protein JHK87_039309 [Glycine soja]
MDRLLTLSCTKEKVMVFTMKTKEHVDPNLLRPGSSLWGRIHNEMTLSFDICSTRKHLKEYDGSLREFMERFVVVLVQI